VLDTADIVRDAMFRQLRRVSLVRPKLPVTVGEANPALLAILSHQYVRSVTDFFNGLLCYSDRAQFCPCSLGLFVRPELSARKVKAAVRRLKVANAQTCSA